MNEVQLKTGNNIVETLRDSGLQPKEALNVLLGLTNTILETLTDKKSVTIVVDVADGDILSWGEVLESPELNHKVCVSLSALAKPAKFDA